MTMARNREYCRQCKGYVSFGNRNPQEAKRQHLAMHAMVSQFFADHPDILELERFTRQYYPKAFSA